MIFYEIYDAGKSCVDYGEGNDWEGIVCSVDEGHRRAGRRITELRLELISSNIVDFSWTILSDIVVTERVVQVFEEAGLTGYELKPTKIVSVAKRVKIKSYPKFWELIVTGQGGHAHPDSGIALKFKCDTCGLVRYSAYEHGIIVDETQWDGSDLFTVIEYPKHILVTERVKNIIESHKLTNVKFLRSNEVKWPEGVIKP